MFARLRLGYIAIGSGLLLVIVVIVGYLMLFFWPERLRLITNILLPAIMFFSLVAVGSLVFLAIPLCANLE